MAKKKTSEPKETETAKATVENNQKTSEGVKAETAKAEKREPQMVTVNGDKVTHGHVFKSNQSDDWYFTAKINDVPLKPQKVSKEDMEGLMNRTKNVAELMQTYYPTKLMPKVSAEDMRLPVSINTAVGEQRLYKFNVYKETHMDNVDYGKYRFYAQVDDQKMSASASRQDLNAYFDKVMKPADMVARVFGDRLGMAEHYRQFQLPEGTNIEAKDIRIMKNQQTNKYEIHANLGEHGRTSARELSYDDKQSYFSHKTATKEQLAAKYLGNEISAAFKNAPKHEQAKQMSLGI